MAEATLPIVSMGMWPIVSMGKEGHSVWIATLGLAGRGNLLWFGAQVSHLSRFITLLPGRRYLPMGNSDLIITASGNDYNFLPAFDSSNLAIWVNACVCVISICAREGPPSEALSYYTFVQKASVCSSWSHASLGIECHENPHKKVNHSS